MLLSEEFRKYRKEQVKAIAEHIHDLMSRNELVKVEGALDMARVLIRLPEKLAHSKEKKEAIRAYIFEDVKSITAKYVKEHLIED